jgi:hypothetical protein
VIDHEDSVILILFYPRGSASDVSKKIDEIRAAYDKSFTRSRCCEKMSSPPVCRFDVISADQWRRLAPTTATGAGAHRMIWINGTFGVGKSGTAQTADTVLRFLAM